MDGGLFIIIMLAFLIGGITTLYHITVKPIAKWLGKLVKRHKEEQHDSAANKKESQTKDSLTKALEESDYYCKIDDESYICFKNTGNAFHIGIQPVDESKDFSELAEKATGEIKDIVENNFIMGTNDSVSESSVADIDGLYMLECFGDNHSFIELYRYRKGERIFKYFEGEYEHYNGWFKVKPGEANIISDIDVACKQGEFAPVYGIYIVAYAFQENAEPHYGYNGAYGCLETSLDIQCNKKNYAMIYAAQGDSFVDILAKTRSFNSDSKEVNWKDAKVLSYFIVRNDNVLMELEKNNQEQQKRGLFSRIINLFYGRWETTNEK